MGLIAGKAILQGYFSALHGFWFPRLSSENWIRERGGNEGRWLQLFSAIPQHLWILGISLDTGLSLQGLVSCWKLLSGRGCHVQFGC